jgi:HK97 family phage portal protein
MSILSTVKGWFSGNTGATSSTLLASILQSGMAPRRGTRELLQAYRTSPWFHAAVHKIATEVASVPLTLHKTKNRAVGERTLKGIPVDSQPVVEHEVLALLEDPNPVFTRMVFLYLVQAYLETLGEAVIVVERGANGSPAELWPIPPHWLVEPPSRTNHGFRFSFMGWQRTIPEEDVVWLRLPDLEQPYARGVGIGETIADEIDIDEFATKHLKNWFFNRAVPDVFLYVEGLKNEGEAQRYEEKLRQKHGGRGKANQVHVVNGKIDVKQVGHTFREQMLPELRDQSRDTTLQIFSIPPEVMGIVENSNRATIDSAFYLFARGVIQPRLAFIVDGLTRWARDEWKDATLTFGFASPVPDDAEFTLKVMVAQPTLFTKNEWRKLAGAETLPKWDEEFPSAPSLSPFGAGPALPTGEDAEEEPEEDEEDAEEEDPEEEKRVKKSSRRGLHPGRVRR